jgi:voltage-gated potassium channel
MRRRAAHILEAGVGHERLATLVNGGIVVLICLNVIAFALGTIPAISDRYGVLLERFEWVSVLLFALEYAVRIWSAPELPLLRGLPHARARLHHASRPMQIVDLIAFLPALIDLLVPLNLDSLRALRVLRLLRVWRYSTAMQSLGHVLRTERASLFGALVIMLSLIFIAGTAMYLAERTQQPKVFGTVPDAMWWAIVTLSTVGYGDTVPVSAVGKILGAVTIIVGMCVFALPIGIIASGFAHELQRRNFVVTWALLSRVPLFSGLDGQASAQIMGLLKSETYDEGEVIVHKGDVGDAMYFIASGSALVEDESGDIPLSEGEFFGELALIERRQRSHTVIASQNKTRCLVLDRDDLERLGRRFPHVVARIREVAEARRRSNSGQGESGPL